MSKESEHSGGCCGCIGLILIIIFIWALIFGVTVGLVRIITDLAAAIFTMELNLTDKTVLDVLKEAKALISDPSKWTTGCSARSAAGLPVNPTDSSAICWCAIGAIKHVIGDGSDDDLLLGKIIDSLKSQMETSNSLVSVNDKGGHAKIIKLFDLTISYANADLDPTKL